MSFSERRSNYSTVYLTNNDSTLFDYWRGPLVSSECRTAKRRKAPRKIIVNATYQHCLTSFVQHDGVIPRTMVFPVTDGIYNILIQHLPGKFKRKDLLTSIFQNPHINAFGKISHRINQFLSSIDTNTAKVRAREKSLPSQQLCRLLLCQR